MSGGSFRHGSFTNGAFTMGSFGGDSLAELIASGEMPGANLPVTVVRTGGRKSMSPLGADVAANVFDKWVLGGKTFGGVSQPAKNLVSPDLTDWTKIGTVGVTGPIDGIYTITVANPGVTSALDWIFAQASNDRIGPCEMRLISGAAQSVDYIALNDVHAIKGVKTLLDTLASDWQIIAPTVASADQTDRLRIRFNSDTTCVIQIRNMRAGDSTARIPAFPDNTGADAEYGTDLVSFVFPASATPIGWACIDFQPYGWSDTGNPADANPVIIEAGPYYIFVNNSGFYETSGGAISTKKPVAGVNSSIIPTWDGVNHTISVDGETPVSNASAIVPSGTGYDGNNAAGTKPAHGIPAILILDGTPTQSESDTWNNSSVNQEVQ